MATPDRSPAPAVRPATYDDAGSLTAMLVRAFHDDPVTRYMFRGDERRTRALTKYFSIQLRQDYLASGQVWTVGDLAGAAVWAPPTKPRPGVRDNLRLARIFPELAALGAKTVAAIRTLLYIEAHRPRYDHWYLATLGTEPDRQGTGVGSALLARVLEQVDAEGLPAYLESSKERNVPFYARFGFEVVEEFHTFGGGPPMWFMLRPATG